MARQGLEAVQAARARLTLPELGAMKTLIRQIDPNAFVVINNTLEVMNYRIGNQPHW